MDETSYPIILSKYITTIAKVFRHMKDRNPGMTGEVGWQFNKILCSYVFKGQQFGGRLSQHCLHTSPYTLVDNMSTIGKNTAVWCIKTTYIKDMYNNFKGNHYPVSSFLCIKASVCGIWANFTMLHNVWHWLKHYFDKKCM